MNLKAHVAELGVTLGEELLAPHRCYWRVLQPLLAEGWLKGLVHVTGGGITDNTPRILPRGCRAEVNLNSWPVLPIFSLIAKRGRVLQEEMLRTFNMGVGMLLVVAQRHLTAVTTALKKKRETFFTLGRIVPGPPGVKYV